MFGGEKLNETKLDVEGKIYEGPAVPDITKEKFKDLFSADYIDKLDNSRYADGVDIKPQDLDPNMVKNFYIDIFADDYNTSEVGDNQAEEVKSYEEDNKESREPNITYRDSEGNKCETDDNGNTYKKNGELLPNTDYTINGYHYKTDSQGRITEAGGELKLTVRDKRKTINEDMKNIGKGDEQDTDERGHLIGDQFDGVNRLENLVPMDANLNKGEFKALENKLADAVRDGKNVTMKVEVIYQGDSNRPSGFLVTYSIDGEKDFKYFENKGADNNELRNFN